MNVVSVKRLLAICLVCFVGISGAEIVFGKDAPTSAQQLRQDFESALKAKDRAAILALYNWDGVSDWVKDFREDDVDNFLTRDVQDAILGDGYYIITQIGGKVATPPKTPIFLAFYGLLKEIARLLA